MTYWPWWSSGVALSFVMLFHWFSLHRMMAVSGRFSALIDRFRHGKPEPVPELTEAQLLAAIQEATAAEFSESDQEHAQLREAAPPKTESVPPHLGEQSTPWLTQTRTTSEHLLFLLGLVLGGAMAAGLSGWHGDFALRGAKFAQLTGDNGLISSGLLLLGGICVGFGTRMAGGCTSGHGLCGTSRLQSGSLLATASFFGAGIATSFALGTLL